MNFSFNNPSTAKFRKNFLAPEVVQTSAMDCGPASLKCLLEGFNIPVSYERLREACQTDVDGTSIDTLETILGKIGLEAEQIMVPMDHMLLPEAQTLPAIVVVRLPNQFAHFIVTWERIGPMVQVMDPAIGRYWVSRQRFLSELYIHTHPVPASAWREWVGSDEFLGAFHRRLADLGLVQQDREYLTQMALSDPTWNSMARLDAAARMVAALTRSGGLYRGSHVASVLKIVSQAAQVDKSRGITIPSAYWSVQPAPFNTDGEEQLLLRGALLIRVKPPSAVPSTVNEAQNEDTPSEFLPELETALKEKPVQPWFEIWRYLRADGLLNPMFLTAMLFFSACGTIFEALFFRGLLNILSLTS